jgi:hypothetical protein
VSDRRQRANGARVDNGRRSNETHEGGLLGCRARPQRPTLKRSVYSELTFYLLGLIPLGVIAARQELLARRWDAEFYRTGVRVFRRTMESGGVVEMPMPSAVVGGLPGWLISSKRLSAHEVVFVAPDDAGLFRDFVNGSLLRGILRIDPATNTIEVVGHLQWGTRVLMAAATTMLGDFAFSSICIAIVTVSAMFTYRRETERFHAVFDDATSRLARGYRPKP